MGAIVGQPSFDNIVHYFHPRRGIQLSASRFSRIGSATAAKVSLASAGQLNRLASSTSRVVKTSRCTESGAVLVYIERVKRVNKVSQCGAATERAINYGEKEGTGCGIKGEHRGYTVVVRCWLLPLRWTRHFHGIV